MAYCTYKVKQEVLPIFLQQAPHIFADVSICTLTVALCQQICRRVQEHCLVKAKSGLESC